MKPEGWYPDPSGAPDTERYWDGHSWSTVVRSTAPRQTAGWSPTGVYDPSATQPVAAQPMPVPGVPGPTRTGKGWYALLAISLLGTIALVLALWRPWAPPLPAPTQSPATTDARPTVAPPTAMPTATATSPASPRPTAAPLNCANGAGRWSSREPFYTSYGVTITPPVDMPVRLEAAQWSWLQQGATWATRLKAPVGFALGGVRYDQGFGTLESASLSYLKCLTSYGILQGGPIAGQSSQLSSFDGRPALQTRFVDDSGLSFRLYIVDTSDPDGYASLLVFHPTGDAAGSQVVDDLLRTAKVG